MAKKFLLHPVYPKRIYQDCNEYYSTNTLGCGNGPGRIQHPTELLDDNWYEFGDRDIDMDAPQKPGTPA